MAELRGKSMLLTAHLELALADLFGQDLSVITPTAAADRGCQLSLKFSEEPLGCIFHILETGSQTRMMTYLIDNATALACGVFLLYMHGMYRNHYNALYMA